MKTTPEQQRLLLDRCRSAVRNWKSVAPETLYKPIIRSGIMRIKRVSGKPPEIVWL